MEMNNEHPGLESRVAKIEGILEKMRSRLNHLESEFRDLRGKLRMNFRWTIGIIITMWVTIILAIVGVILTILLGG